MIFFLTTKKHDYTIRMCLRTEGRALAGQVRSLCYGRLFLMRRFPAATWIFSDIERLGEDDRSRAQAIRDRLAESSSCRVLNAPQNSWRRFQLLRSLYEQGANRFNVHRLADDPRPERFPVFVRGENDHQGAQSALLHTQADLDELIAGLDRSGQGREGLIATEFCDTSDANGVFRKYSMFRIGERILPRHLFFSERWCLKNWDRLDPELLEEERRYVRDNPHHDQVKDVFEQARIEFGRIDYSVVDGRIQVWEINTNPMLPVDHGGGGPARQALQDGFREAFVEAMRAVDTPPTNDRVRTERRAVPLWAAAGIPWRAAAARWRSGRRAA